MVKSTSPPVRRKYLQNRYLLLFVGVLVASVLATFMQVNPQSSAAEINEVEVSHRTPEAELHSDEKTCIIRTRAHLRGDTERVNELVGAVADSAKKGGLSVDTGTVSPAPGVSSTDLILFKKFDLAEEGATKEHCTTETVVEDHHGRRLTEIPEWARGMLAAAASAAVYLGVVFAVTATFAFLAPEFMVYGEIAGGCVGGFASTYVANLINNVPQDANLTQSAVKCIVGAILNISLGDMKQKMVDSIKAWVRSDAQSVASAASPTPVSDDAAFASALSDFADAIPATPPTSP